eukprot:CAMPEP_0172374390 /NCGR_PEP_ID=MMETSP1060-20121228/55609_1 /TAXON_ID=37318 /ORGANISM="Pseudo-nitzschia pungens, Strain cf. cingulata" /LENGTH=295 /DNA_ID=CAMNT_0013101041 /DNA_START=263 /DNA_END=1150 /DNA_ORIENTATION=+
MKVTKAFVPSVGPVRNAIGTSEIYRHVWAETQTATSTTQLRMASKKKAGKKPKKKSSGSGKGRGGGFGGRNSADESRAAAAANPIPADKDSLETQWDTFASITDLEIRPLGDPEDDDYEHFQVVDVFVRCGGSDSDSDSDSDSNSNSDNDKTETGWFRIGKVCTSEDTPLSASLSLQKGLILWTAVHMRRELLAKGKAGARALELGFIEPASITMGEETDGPLDAETAEACELSVVSRAPKEDLARAAAPGSFGFRPDWNPRGFTYKRRESAARKDKKKTQKSSGSLLDEVFESL